MSLPSVIDWRPYATPIKDQKNCGSCAAFGTCGVWEACIKIYKNMPNFQVDLSEEDLFFCSNGTCEDGNTIYNILTRAKRGISTESCCPYVDKDVPCGTNRCANWWLTGYKIDSFAYVFGGGEYWQLQDNVRKALQTGPIIGVMIVHESFKHYQGGIYHSLGPQDIVDGLHCIGIFGYDDTKQALLIRNSWGVGWGEEGYAWISYAECVGTGDNGSGLFGLSYQLNVTDARPDPDPTPPPPSIAVYTLDYVTVPATLTLKVVSSYGSPNPNVGVHPYDDGTYIICNVVSPVIVNGVSYTCTGWTGMGSVQASGTALSTAFIIKANSTITWNWMATPIPPPVIPWWQPLVDFFKWLFHIQ